MGGPYYNHTNTTKELKTLNPELPTKNSGPDVTGETVISKGLGASWIASVPPVLGAAKKGLWDFEVSHTVEVQGLGVYGFRVYGFRVYGFRL